MQFVKLIRMNRKVGPFILLGVLFIILVFIVGLRYGKRVANTDAVVSVVLSITPTPTTEVKTEPLIFLTFIHEGCDIQFLYPDTIKTGKEASDSATLTQDNTEAVSISCAKLNDIQKMITDPKLATEEVKLNTQTIKARTNPDDPSQKLYFQVRNPKNGRQVFIVINKNLYPLFASTLQYLP